MVLEYRSRENIEEEEARSIGTSITKKPRTSALYILLFRSFLP